MNEIAISRLAALRMLGRAGIPALEATLVLNGARPASQFDGMAYYWPADIERLAARFIMDQGEEW